MTGDSVSFFPPFLLLLLTWRYPGSRAVQVKDCAPVIVRTKERPDNEPVNGELQLKEPQWPCMLGIGLDDIKEWNLHWGLGGQAFRKEVLFALYQSAVSHEKKQFKLTLKKGILPYAYTPYVSLIERLIRSLLTALSHGDVTPVRYGAGTRGAGKTKRWTIVYALLWMLRSTFEGFAPGQAGFVRAPSEAFPRRKKKWLQVLVKFTRERDAASVTRKNCASERS